MATLRNRKQRTDALETPEYGWIWKPLLALLLLYLLVCIGLGIWWSQRPSGFDVEQAVIEQRNDAAKTPTARGTVTTATLMTVIDTLLDKPGGYLRNDVAPPGLWLDNMPSWEYGVLNQARILLQAMPGMGDGNVAGLEEASEALSADSRDWLYPAAEKRYVESREALGGYLQQLSGEGAPGFSAQGDGLAQWLQGVSQRFDALTHRLSASIDDPEALRELGVGENELPDPTPWHHIDNTFFEARGDAWALLHLLKGARHDYADVLASAEASGPMERLIAELEMSQRRLWSPMVLNGSGFGIFANHSLTMANYTVGISEQARVLAGRLQGVQVERERGSGEQPSNATDSQADQVDGNEGGGKPQAQPSE